MRALHDSALAATLLAATAFAQAPNARVFLPAEHTALMRANIDELVEAGLWDAIERSVLRMPLAAFYDTFGFDLADVDRVQFAQRIEDRPDEAVPWRQQRLAVWTFEGSDRVTATKLNDQLLLGSEVVQVADVAVHRHPGGGEIASPAPGLLVLSDPSGFHDSPKPPPRILSDTLLSTHASGGVPAADLMPLTASRNALVRLAMVGSTKEGLDPATMRPFPSTWFAPDRPLDGVRFQLVREPETDALRFELLLRFRDMIGAAHMAKAYDDTLAELAADRSAAPLAALLKPVTKTVAKNDVTLTLDLGTGRDATAEFTRLLGAVAPLMILTARPGEPVEAVEIAAPVAPEPVPEKKDPDKRDR